MTKLVLLATLALSLSSCISKMLDKAIPQQGKNQERVNSAKTAAIVAFDVMSFVPTGVGSKLVGGSLSTAQYVSNTVAQETELAKDLYAHLQKQMTAKGIKVIPLDQVVNNPLYQKLYAAKKGGLAEKQGNQYQKANSIKNLLRNANPSYLFSAEERAQLAQALNVDTLVMARVSFSPIRNNDYLGIGIASAYLKSNVAFHMYERTGTDPIWFHYSFEGPQSEESIGKVSGMEDAALVSKLSQPLGEKTIENLISTK